VESAINCIQSKFIANNFWNKTYNVNVSWIFCRLGLTDVGWFIDQLQLQDPTMSQEDMKIRIRNLMVMKANTKHRITGDGTAICASLTMKDDNSGFNFATDAADDIMIFDASPANGDTVTNTHKKEIAADDETFELEFVPVTNTKKFDTGSNNEQPEPDFKMGLIYLITSKDQIKIGSSVDNESSELPGVILPDMTNPFHRYSTFLTILFVYLPAGNRAASPVIVQLLCNS